MMCLEAIDEVITDSKLTECLYLLLFCLLFLAIFLLLDILLCGY